MKKLLIEGWRFLPHSYALVNQFQCLEFLENKDLKIFHHDLPFFKPGCKPVSGLLSTEAETKLKNIPEMTSNEKPDAVYRISYPYPFNPITACPLFVFATAEFGALYSDMFTPKEPLQKILVNSGIKIITPSNWSRKGFISSGADPEKTWVIPHGVDIRIFKPLPDNERNLLRKKFGWNENFVFFNNSAMTGNKGIILLLKAFAEIIDFHPEVKLVLKGLDSLYASEKLLGELLKHLPRVQTDKILPRIVFIGNTVPFSEIAKLYQVTDVYVSPYLAEAFNMPVLEAMACGLPVLCTEGGPTDDFVSSDTALKIKSHLNKKESPEKIQYYLLPEVEHLILLMKEVIQNTAWTSKARIAGPQSVAGEFTWKHITDRLLKIIFKKDF